MFKPPPAHEIPDSPAATRPTMRFVALKSEAQLDMQTLHRVRDQLVGGAPKNSIVEKLQNLAA